MSNILIFVQTQINKMQPRIFYNARIDFADHGIKEGVRKVRLFTLLRLLVFVVFALPLYFLWGNAALFIGVFIAGTALFLWMVSMSVDAKLLLEKARELKKINENELNALDGDWSAFDAGSEFADGRHPFSNDLDLFAPKGVFGFMNRTVTLQGKLALARLILDGTERPERNNEIIGSLSEEIEWTQTFRVSGSISSREEGAKKRFSDLAQLKLDNPAWMKWVIYLVPIFTIPALALYYFDLISAGIFSGVVVLAMYPTGRLLKTTNATAEKLGSYESKAAMMLEQVQSLKDLKNEHAEIAALKDSLTQGNLSAEKALHEWLQINKRFELRLNIVVSIPLNLFVAWDLRQRAALEKWLKTYGEEITAWEATLAALEVYISGATLRYNHPQTVFAQFSETSDVSIRNMIHPLLADSKVVSNHVEMSSENQFMILTGPNMAGKSTYLRALGLVFVFANAGFPVYASSVRIPKLKLYSSMRTADDLSNESSYFHAELTRLRFIMDALEREDKIFILLDEILKGTNSKDKEEGSRRFLRKLQAKGAKGVIATHDLSLCTLSEESSVFSNGCFDSTIEGNNLSFDYAWRPGICQNMNASFLLKQMRLVD